MASRMYRRYWTKSHNPTYTQVEVEGGKVINAWVDQVLGKTIGNARNYIGMDESELPNYGFKLFNPSDPP